MEGAEASHARGTDTLGRRIYVFVYAFARMHAAFLRCYRWLLPTTLHAQPMTDVEVLRATGMPAPFVVLLRQLVMLFARAAKKAPPSVLYVLAAAATARRS